MRVRDVMTKDVIAVRPSTTYEEAAKLIYENKISGLPVTDEHGKVVGMLSEKDLLRAMYPSYKDYLEHPEAYYDQEARETKVESLRDQPIKNFMNAEFLHSIGPDAPILRAGGLMLAEHVHRLPVIENGRLIGIITRENIYGTILKHYLKL